MAQSQAYQRYVSKLSSQPWCHASQLARKFRPHIHALREQYGRQSDNAGIMGKIAAAQYLTRAIETPLCEIDETSDLCQEKTVTVTEQGESVKIKSVNKLDALAQLSKLGGYNEAEKVEITHHVDTPLIRFIASLDGKEARHVLGNRGNPLPLGEFRPLAALADADLVPIPANLEPVRNGREVVFKSQLDGPITSQSS